MPEIIECPQCQRKLRMDDSVLGQMVQCPSCQHTFTAATQDRPTPLRPRPDDDAPVYKTRDEEPPVRPRYDERPPRRPYDDDDDDYPRRSRRRYDERDYLKPHRGSMIQTLGIVALVFCFCTPVVGIIIAIVTIVLAMTDLSAMRRGEMDDSGIGQTKTGLTCAIIAIALDGVALFACIGINLLDKEDVMTVVGLPLTV